MMKKILGLLLVLPGLGLAQQTGWGNISETQQEVFSWSRWWTQPLFSGFWMAWTRATVAFFVFIFAAMAVMTVIELRWPGGNQRDGILGLTTTRGDRLFVGLLGATYIFIAWLAFFGAPLYLPLVIAVAWLAFCFWKV